MKNKALTVGLSLLVGTYLYEVIDNLLSHQPLSNALTNLDWKRVIFIGVFGAIISHFFYKTQAKK